MWQGNITKMLGMLGINRKGNYSLSDWSSLSQGHLKISKQWRQVPECFEFILTVLAMIADDLTSKVRNKTNWLQRHLLFHTFFPFSSTYFLSFTLLCLTDEQCKLEKKKFCILYSYTLFPLRYRFFTAGDKDIADFSFIETDIMLWYCFIMACISLTAPPNRTPYLLPFFPTSKYGPWMSLREEHCFAMVELESCDCVRHRFINSSHLGHHLTEQHGVKRKGPEEELRARKDGICLVTRWRKGSDAALHAFPAMGALLSVGSQEKTQVRPSRWGWGTVEPSCGCTGCRRCPHEENTNPEPNGQTCCEELGRPVAGPSQDVPVQLPVRPCCEFSRPNGRGRGPDRSP